MELLKEAALKNPSLLSRISASAESDPVHRKIFVHGLGWDATTETLASVFCQYGEIEECRVVVDRNTGRSKGYGFVLFRTRAAARKALKEPQKRIGHRMTSCQLASFGPPGAQGPAPDSTGRKIFVSGIADHINPERLRAFFTRFGEIEEGPLGYDRNTGRLRGFAIFVYKSPDSCKKALEEPKKFFEGCELHCQRAVEGLKPKTPSGAAAVAGGAAAVPAVLQPNDLALTYASQSMLGLNPMAGLVGQSLNPAMGLMGQNSGVGMLNPGVATVVTPSLNRSATTTQPYGVGLGLGGGGTGVNSISPSIIGSYGSQAALQGLGAYQNSQLSSTTSMRSQSGVGSMGTGLPSYLGR
uniref:UBP1-associated protein 2A n=2 Tax=Elaeis guineensis var. tenera TaxID=51953 RepID=A0A6I9QB15_ELAGV|nr:UBP1-associated protein 2A [Elaeis guineensis]